MQSDDLGLALLLRSRIGVEFDGEAHLTEAEAQSVAAAIERLEANEKELRRIISECAAALPNGAFISPEASIEFMANLPTEIKACSERLVAERDEAREDAEVAEARRLQHGALADKAFDEQFDRAETAEAQRDKLKEALKPFAEAAESIDDTVPDRAEMWEAPAAMETTAGDFRRARQALGDT